MSSGERMFSQQFINILVISVIAVLVVKCAYLQFLYDNLLSDTDDQFPQNDNIASKEDNSCSKIGFSDLEEDEACFLDTRNIHKPILFESSGWCSKLNESEKTDRFCHFQNLCFLPYEDDFVFFYGPNSVMEQIHFGNPDVIDLSSVKNHNAYKLSLTFLPYQALENFKVHWINRSSLIFDRFKPDNLMHVMHDDIIPLHHTLKLVTMGTRSSNQSDPFDVNIILFDGWDEGDFIQFYKIFTKSEIIFKEDMYIYGGMVCFADLYAGLKKTSTWYQYGFREPQGPIPNHSAAGYHIHSTVKFILQNLNIKSRDVEEYIVVLQRKDNRLILNKRELTLAVAKKTQLKVKSVSLEEYSLKEVIDIIYHAKVIIGMHGSLLILTMFLKPGSVVIELFPFAVSPNNYTPYKTLVNLPGMHIIYRAWASQKRENSVSHPDWSPELGGIIHLSKEKQEQIVQQTEVPIHLCCNDPSWLYHIYQDTKVEISEILSVLTEALEQSKLNNSYLLKELQPSKIKAIKCKFDADLLALHISWQEPWNIKYLQYSANPSYEILLQESSSTQKITAVVTDKTYIVLKDGLMLNMTYFIWVRCVLGANPGPYSYVAVCNTSLK
ncbi:hypothetical protein CHS0354_013546 [Potamilus streckersoni]|uniref:Protein O-linked-mannose beta-1,4-N-acetylglucosaminyltransferase 2 n=1 Tax=Potamilus streckersoni TaxID=2493646 RepID=A0AAE0WA02_9BIVA|nr:hypothetical protein CHS0354_013546 [Potamilus streckersoni]